MNDVKPLTVLLPVILEKKEILRSILEKIQKDLKNNEFFPFDKMQSIHFGRLVILDEVIENDKIKYPCQLLISTNYFTDSENHLKELFKGDEVDQLLTCCDGYPVDRELSDKIKYIKRHSNYRAHFYRATWGRTADQIKKEEANRHIVNQQLGIMSTLQFDATKFLDQLKEMLFNNPNFSQEYSAIKRPTVIKPILILIIVIAGLITILNAFSISLKSIGIGFLYFLLAFVIVVACGYFYLRHLEKTDVQLEDLSASTDQVSSVSEIEDLGVQNQFTHLVELKAGYFRYILLNIVLKVIAFSAYWIFNKGKLGDIPTIHFARWVIIDKGKRLLFLSNFDGSWENYLGDFVDKAATGLTAIWSNTKLFPRSRSLLFDGATDEQRFKAVARKNQVQTNVWYSAYPELSVVNVSNNTDIQRGLMQKLEPKEIAPWLERSLGIRKPHDIDKTQIQGLILNSFFNLKQAYYLLISIEDVSQFKKWMAATKFTDSSSRPTSRAINIALTPSGLEKLGVGVSDENGFSPSFVEGMDTNRKNRALGDIGNNHYKNWKWGGRADRGLDAMVLLYAKNKAECDLFYNTVSKKEHGFCELHPFIEGIFLPGGKEHFGFRDGVSQPAIKGISSRTFFNDVVEPGEFILGHNNQYNKLPNSPRIYNADKDTYYPLGYCGSYMVFRQLKQDVRAFWEAMTSLSDIEDNNINPAIELASKMVGRKPDGTALAAIDPTNPKEKIKEKNTFNYYDSDESGLKCPFGAHIRRTNPRDSLSLSASEKHKTDAINIVKNHRLLRRGRIFGKPVSKSMDIEDILDKISDLNSEEERGLNFVCFNTAIDRQFEFVQHTWINNPKFHDLYEEVDPLVGLSPKGQTHATFSVPDRPVQCKHANIPSFVTVLGGAYFFFPGIHAIHYLSRP